MPFMYSKGNLSRWFVLGMTTLQASHRNSPTTPPVAKWSKIKAIDTLNGSCFAITTGLYNSKVFLMLYMYALK